MTAVAVVDDEAITRKGTASELEGQPGIDSVRTYTHDDAMRLPAATWLLFDVVVVDAGDPRKDDQFPGVHVVEALRSATPSRHPLVIVVTGHFFHDALRKRMREAGADLYYHRSDFAEEGSLLRAVLGPRGDSTGVPEPRRSESLFRMGVGDGSRVNAGLHWIDEHGGVTGMFVGASRYSAYALRKTFNEIARLDARNRDGTRPDRNQDVPSRHHIARFHHWATRINDGADWTDDG